VGKQAETTPQQCLTPNKNAAIIAALFEVGVSEGKRARQVVWWQMAIVAIVAALAYSLESTPQFVMAVLSGGAVAVLNGALLAWRMHQATLRSAHDAHLQLRLMYFYAAERFLVVVALLGICLAVLKLSPLAVLGGFVAGQAALLAARLFLSRF
jgi:hypothetical protein